MKNAAVASLCATSGSSRGFMKQTDIHQYLQTLRLHLLDMSRVSQRGVDYSIKAYKLGCPEFCASVRDNTDEINILDREITEIVEELLLMELPRELDLRLILTSARICNALQAMHSQAVEIARNSMRLLENGGLRCTDLTTMGDVVNAMVRLCVVSLFDERIEHAQTVLHSDGVERLFETTFYDWYRTVDHRVRTQAGYELAITKHLSQIVRQTIEMAEAIVFWLEGPDSGSASHIGGEQSTIYIVPAREVEGVTCSPDGMQAFLAEIDTCFANPCFWSRL